MNEDTLRGNSFIGKIVLYDDPKDEAYGNSIERRCGLCFYRDRPENIERDCWIMVYPRPSPKKLFGFKEDEYLPEQLDGKEVGNYCPYFTDFRVE